MVNQELLAYIKQNNQQGFSREQTTNALTEIGWSLADVNEGFATVELGSVPPQQNHYEASQVTSTPAVTTRDQYAGFWLRVVASLLDFAVINLITILIGFVYVTFFAKNSLGLPILPSLISIALWVVYFPYMESRSGATFGKSIVGIQVQRSSGQLVKFPRSLGRNLATFISAAILGIGFIMAAFTAKKQCLHDIMTDCVVVQVKKKNVFFITALAIISIIIIIVLPLLVVMRTLLSVFG